jgi:sterol desaturase/sphingolipid hydroxylase (fatty acid hydroxylase superfamily)
MFQSLFEYLWPIICVVGAALVLEFMYPWRTLQQQPLRWLHAVVLFVAGIALTYVVLPLGSVNFANVIGTHHWGLFNVIPLPSWLALVLGIFILDFVQWTCHWAMHRIPALWNLHRLHHSDETLDASTAFRFHPLETLARFGVQLAAIALFGIAPFAVVFRTGAVLFFDVWEHANVRMPASLGILSLVFVTPDLHRVHHDENIKNQNSNLGTIFSIWDRLFGSYNSGDNGVEEIKFGLGKDNRSSFKTIANLLFDPFRHG